MHEIHHDSAFYANPSRFDAFRFSRPNQMNETKEEVADTRSAVNAINLHRQPDAVPGSDRTMGEAAKSGGHAQSNPGSKQQSVTTGGDAFSMFGHGKHSCPGRFLRCTGDEIGAGAFGGVL